MERKEAIEVIKKNWPDSSFTMLREALETLIPELKESGDEKIRKGLIAIITDFESLYLQENYALSKEDALAWLEKQGESTDINPSEFDLRLNKLLKQFETLPKEELASSLSFYLNVVQNDGTYKREEKGGEQPRYSIGDVLCDKSCTTLNKDAQSNFEITDIRNGMYICDKCSFPISQQDEYELVAKKIEQKPAEWSEEDERMLESIISDFAAGHKSSIGQDKWLKSLKPQNHWKPTKEQIEAIRIAAEVGTANDSWAMGILKKLYNQLKLEQQ